MTTPSRPAFEHHRVALGIGTPTPRLTWQTVCPESCPEAEPGWRQAAYEVEIVRAGGVESRSVVESAESVLVPWPAAPLRSRERAEVRVRVRGEDGEWSGWSDPGVAETGLLAPADWTAVPVGADWPEDPESDRRPALVRHEFELRGLVSRARLYASAHGLYEAELNGERVGDDTMSPGWTVYGERLRYYTYDVTSLVRPGANVLGAWLADGWYRGRLGWNGGFRNLYGSDQSFIGQLEVEYADGSSEIVAAGPDWQAAPSPILCTGNYDGETYDAREEQPGWSTPGFDASEWTAVAVHERDAATLVAPDGPPVRCTQDVTPIAVLRTPSGRIVLDLGQNLVGRLRIRVRGERGTTVTIRTSEVLQDGEIYQRPLRTAKSTDTYILNGDSVEEWEPRFTFHGFRYAEVDGWPGDLEAAVAAGDVVARVLHTDLERTGWFECSDPLVNKLHENVVWSMRGNFLDIPTDCPQRDERVGWTGDIQVFAPTASYLYDVSGMLSGWLQDVAVEQLPDGCIPWYVPVIPAHDMWTPIRPGALWGDVAVLTPWVLYERYGDVDVLRAQYDSAKAWVELMDRLAGPDHLWNEGFQLGDWLDPAAPPDDPADARTDRYLVATAYFAYSAEHLAKTAHVLGRADDAKRFGELAALVRAAFCAEYVGADGRMTSDAQTAYALALEFELIENVEQRTTAGNRLAELVAEDGNLIATGFAGTPIICDALTRAGAVDSAYDVLLQKDCPSWLYAVTQGATTIWERWDSMRPDGTVNPGRMTSFNHYALGAVADWMHRTVAGLAPTAPGYRSIRFRPQPGGGLTWARAEHETPYGRAAISWSIEAGELRVGVTVPTGTDAVVELPGRDPEQVGNGRHSFTVPYSAPSQH
jgi:alpha-L-rhamnosidase